MSQSICSYVVGIIGNIFSFGLSFSPALTFRRIIKNKSTEQFSGIPYLVSLLNCLIGLWYGLPVVSSGIILVATVNSVGVISQLIYISIFITYTEKPKKVKMLGSLLAIVLVFATIIVVSIEIFEPPKRKMFVGCLNIASFVAVLVSPLFILSLVVKTKSVEYMPFYFSLSLFLSSVSFFTYGMLKHDPFIYVANGIGSVLGMIQLGFYFYYNNKTSNNK